MFDADSLVGLVERTKSQDVDQGVLDRLDQILKRASRLVSLRALSGHVVVQELLREYEAKAANDRRDLLGKRDMDPLDRLNAMDRIALYEDLSSRFDAGKADAQLERLKAEVEAISKHVSAHGQL